MTGNSQTYITARKVAVLTALRKDPTIPTKTLARRLVKEHGTFFTSVENARTTIRYYRGAKGLNMRHGQRFENKKRNVNVPDSVLSPEPTIPVELQLKGNGTILSDFHIPYHSKPAVEAALEHSQKHSATDWLLINGDFLDFYGISFWSRNPLARRVEEELAIGREFLEELAKVYKRVVFKFGNHERRFTSYLYANAPEMAGLPCLSLNSLFAIDKVKIEFIGAQQIMTVGRYLTILHGHEFMHSAHSPVNPARGAFLRAKNNCMVGHFHRPSEHVEGDIRKTMISTFSLGCLCDLSPPYAPVNSFTHGFATMKIEKDDFEVENYRITGNYKVR